MNDESSEDYYLTIVDVSNVHQESDGQRKEIKIEKAKSVRPRRRILGREPISLNQVEYRILELLASKPYHAFTPRRIVEAVTTPSHPVTEETLRDHIASLRDKLGFFSDYIQSVPYIGYRFKA
jgi:DNA-binding response OmpR family regulator